MSDDYHCHKALSLVHCQNTLIDICAVNGRVRGDSRALAHMKITGDAGNGGVEVLPTVI